MSPWWFLPSPTAGGAMAYHHVNQTEFGNSIVAYQYQFDANVKHRGFPESMHLGTLPVYIGHIGNHLPPPSV